MIDKIIKNIQNPALGAYLLWETSNGYCKEKGTRGIPLYLLFFILPFLMNENIYTCIVDTRISSSIYKFFNKLSPANKTQLYNSINSYSSLTLSSIGLGTQTGLLCYDKDESLIIPNLSKIPCTKELNQKGKQAQKLGKWLSQVSIAQLINITERF